MKGAQNQGRSFELKVVSRGNGDYGLALYELQTGRQDAELVERIWGDPLHMISDRILRAVRNGGVRPSSVGPRRKEPIPLREEDAVRTGVLFLALKPMRKLSRIEAIAERVSAMEPEELWYWYAKVTSPVNGRRARRALRLLLAEE